jgi:hypothetical protein
MPVHPLYVIAINTLTRGHCFIRARLFVGKCFLGFFFFFTFLFQQSLPPWKDDLKRGMRFLI